MSAEAPVDVVLAVDAIKPPLTGIGRYAWELATRLPAEPGVASVRYYGHSGFVDDPAAQMQRPPAMLAARRRALRSRLAVAAWRLASPLVQRAQLARLRDHVFHGPNFYLPRFDGCAVATIHDLSIFRYPQFHPPERVRFMEREIPRSLARATLLIADAEFVRREVVEHFGWPEARIVRVPLAPRDDCRPREPAETAPVLARLGLAHGRYALCVSTIEPRKNIAGLLRAYAGIEAAARRQFPLVLAGDRGWLSGDIHARIEAGAAQGWVRYLGYVADDDLPALYAGARAFLLPSLYEGFGLPVLEAMASGVPVLVSRDSTLSEVAGAAACLVDPQDDGALREAIGRVLGDEPWRAQAQRAGLDRAAEYSWHRTVSATLDAYRLARRLG